MNPLAHPLAREVERWKNHEFYAASGFDSAVVLGLDIGIEGIGVWLRKGPKPLFAHTFLVSLPEATPLKNRRQKRAWRHARQSRRKREQMLQKWIVRHGLLSPERLKKIWNNPSVFERAFEHRFRALTDKLASPEALAVCIRHIVKHRGYDYHLTGEGAYPWGDELDYKEIIKWAKHAYCTPTFRASIFNEVESDAPWAKDSSGQPTDKFQAVKNALDEAVKNHDSHPVKRMLENHMREKGHPNLRERARGHNFPRELVKNHLFDICKNHEDFLAGGRFETAMRELLGDQDPSGNRKSTWLDAQGAEHQTIVDYHRRTPEEAERIWLRKTKNCPFAECLHELGRVSSSKIKCDLRSDPRVRRFNLLMFLAERRIELANNERSNVSQDVVKALLKDLEQDVAATKAQKQNNDTSPRPAKPGKRNFEELFQMRLAGVKEGSFNKDVFDQLGDLVRPELRKLRDRAPLCGESAEALYQLATKGETIFEPAAVKQALRDCGYYDWRKDQERGLGIYPQVEFLLGQRKHYNNEGAPRDVAGRRDGQPQHHGVLRKLFTGQLRLDDGTVVNLEDELGDATVPDYVVVETIGDIPRNRDERAEKKKEISDNRSRKDDIIQKKYGLQLHSLSDSQVRRVLLFDQQANDEGNACCPFTGEELGDNPLNNDLELEHIFPESRGGISVMDNLVITERTINQRKNNRTPWEWLARDEGRKVDAYLSAMHWNKQKREYFCCQERDCPQWDNTTRMAQLARHLRIEIIHWLGIRQQSKDDKWISNEIARRVGTPTGYMTGVCRQTWLPPSEFPKMYREISDKQGRVRWIKNRDNLRHHLWDAAVLSHIPPGLGMNSASCGGIFLEQRNPATRELKTVALPGLGPDLNAFERANEDRCLVSKPRQAKSKKSRYKQTILSLPDEEGRLWAREELKTHTAKKGQTLAKLRAYLDRPGLLQPLKTKKGNTVQLLRDQNIEQWWDGVQALALDQNGLLDLLDELRISREKVSPAALAEQFQKKPRRNFTAGQLLAFLRKHCGATKEELPDSHVEDFVAERATRAVLRANNGKNGLSGQSIGRVRIEQDQQAFVGPHYTSKAKQKVVGFKAVDNSTTVTYLRREIWIGQRLKKKGKQAVAETFYEHQLIPHPRHLATRQKIAGEKWRPQPLPKGMSLVGSLSVGDLLRIPIKDKKKNSADSLIAKRGEAVPWGHWFYRVKSLKSGGTVELQLAEYNEPKIEKGKTGTPEQEKLSKLFELSSSNDADLAWLLEGTTGRSVAPPSPVMEATPEMPVKPENCLL